MSAGKTEEKLKKQAPIISWEAQENVAEMGKLR
jgi:hypothetical protein